MNGPVSYETDGFELEQELDELEEFAPSELSDELAGPTPRHSGCRCSSSNRFGELDETYQETGSGELEIALPSWLNPIFRLYRAGRLGWRAGRFIDKATGRVFGKPISSIGADYLYKRLGRSRRLEDFFDSLPARVKRWLNQF